MNWRRGLLRVWLVASAVWIGCAGWLFIERCRASLRGDYELVLVLKKGMEFDKIQPWKTLDEFKTYFRLPSEMKPPAFYKTDKQDVAARKQQVKDGDLAVRHFSDGERLYVESFFDDKEIAVAKDAFWHQRFDRLLDAALNRLSYFLPLALLPPVFAVGAFFGLRWAMAGFR